MNALKKLFQRSKKILVPGANVVKLYPMWGSGEAIYFWAERGQVHWEDGRTNGYGTLSIKEACERVLAISEMAIESSDDRRWAKERYDIQAFVTGMENVIRQAQEQGDPHSPDAGRELKRRRAKPVSMSRAIDNVIVGDPTSPYSL